jgi:hypothetical protein
MALTSTDEVLTFMGLPTASERRTVEVALADLLVPIACNLVKEYVGYEIEFGTFIEYHPDAQVAPVEDELIDGWEVIGGRVVPRGPRGHKARAVIQLTNLPVRQIDSIYEAPDSWDNYPPTWASGTLLTEGTHYRVDYDNESFPGVDATYTRMSKTGFLIRRVGIWTPVARSVKVTYKAGYTSDELAGRFSRFRMAAIAAATFYVKEAKLNAIRGGNTGLLVSKAIDGFAQAWAPPAAMAIYGLTYDLPPSARKLLERDVRMSKFI